MGTDIHAVMEYAPGDGSFSWLGTANLPRNPRVFAAIAFGDGGITDQLPFPPRGLPADRSFGVVELFLDPDEVPDQLGEGLHTPGWLTLSELDAALQHEGLAPDDLQVEYRAMLAALRVLASEYGPDKVRIVFCFDG